MSLLAEAGRTDVARTRRGVVDRLASRLDALAREMADAYLELAAHGATGPSIDSFRASEAATEHLLYLLRAVAIDDAGAPAAADELTGLAAMVRELSGARHSLDEVLDAHGTGFLVAWRAVHDELDRLPAEVLAAARPAIGRALVGAMARSSVVVSEAYEAVGERTIEVATPCILGRALEGGEALVQAMRRAEIAGWPVTAGHTVVVATCEPVDPETPGTPTSARRLMSAIESLRSGGRAPLICTRDGQIVAAFAGPADPSAVGRSWRRLVEGVVLPPGHRVLAGIGLAEAGFAGVVQSYRQARRAVELASTYPGTRIVVSYADVLPQLMLLQDRLLTEDLYRLTLGSLEGADGARGADMVASLRTYLDTGLNLMAAAKELLVHRHTLATRLDKVEQLTGLRIARGDERLLLELGLQAKLVLDRTSAAAPH